MDERDLRILLLLSGILLFFVPLLHFYIFDDKMHDTLFVQHCFILHNTWLKQKGHHFQHHWVWSNGAASQFKARRPFYSVARYYQLTGLQMTHNFSASGHGKREHDGAGAVIKRTLTHEELKPDGFVAVAGFADGIEV